MVRAKRERKRWKKGECGEKGKYGGEKGEYREKGKHGENAYGEKRKCAR
jgi:hypothetical protein